MSHDVLWRFELLGQFRAASAERSLTRFSTRKTAALLAYLAYHSQTFHAREVLIDLCWPESDPQAGRASLRVALASLRRQLEPPGVPSGGVLLSERENLRLNPAVIATDVGEMEALVRAADPAQPEAERVRSLEAALRLYRGPLLPGFYDDWIPPQQQRFADLFCRAALKLAGELARQRETERAIDCLRQAVAIEPLREPIHLRLMELYEAAGNSAAALRQYGELRERLRDEMGVEPGPELRGHARRLEAMLGCPATGPSPSPPRSRPSSPANRATSGSASGGIPGDSDNAAGSSLSPSSSVQRIAVADGAFEAVPTRPNVPYYLSRFVGRSAELERLEHLLEAPEIRLVTLLGPAGSGKTRLAAEAAHRLAARRPVCFVPLADLSDSALIPSAILAALRVALEPERSTLDQIALLLDHRPWLLVLDNLEHLGEEGARTVAALLERRVQLTCLVTSTTRLGLVGETELTVNPLPVPPAREGAIPERLVEWDSVRLFIDRCQTVRPDFQITPGNAGAIREICRRLEGLPLALELAAAWTQVLTPAQVLAGLDSRLDTLMSSRRRDLPRRHRSLRAALEWSCHLLDEDERRFYRGLSVFRGGWTLEAAEAIAGERALELLLRLREYSLVSCVPQPGRPEEHRFQMLEALRRHAGAQLTPEEKAEALRRHASFYLQFARTHTAQFRSGEEPEALHRLIPELDNLRAALEWEQCGGSVEDAAELALYLGSIQQRQGFLREAEQSLRQGLGLLEAEPQSLATTRIRAGLCRELAATLLDRFERAQAAAFAEEARRLSHGISDRQGEAHAWNLLGLGMRGEERWLEARRHLQRALDLFREAGDPVGLAMAANNLGLVESIAPDGSRNTALRHLREALRHFRTTGYERGIAECLTNLGALLCEDRGPAEAWPCFLEILQIEARMQHALGVARALANLGELAMLLEEPAYAQRLLTAARRLFAQSGSPYQATVERLLRATATHLDHETARAVMEEAAPERSLAELAEWVCAGPAGGGPTLGKEPCQGLD